MTLRPGSDMRHYYAPSLALTICNLSGGASQAFEVWGPADRARVRIPG